MKKYGFYLLTLVAILCFATSCGDDDDNHLERWMLANQNVLNEIKANSEYKELRSPGNEGSIFYKVLEKGTGTEPILYTSTVTCYYKGSFVADYSEYNIEKGTVFDQKLFDDGPAASFSVGTGVIKGWTTALQHMVQGDKWEIYVPYQLGYGREGSGSIPGYSTLKFEIEVVTVKGIDD